MLATYMHNNTDFSDVFRFLLLTVLCFVTSDRTQRQEREVMLKLKEVVDKQRDELRAKVLEISKTSKEVEAVRQQTHTLQYISE